MSADSFSEKAKQLLGPVVGKLALTAPPAVVRDLVVGLVCRQPPEVIREVAELLTSYLPDAELQRLLQEAVSRVRDPAALLPPALDVAGRFETQDALLRELADHGPPIGRDGALHVVASSMRGNSSLSCFRLWEDLRDLALQQQSTIDHVIQVYVHTVQVAEALEFDLQGARVLELGPGHSLLGGILLLLQGAGAYHAADPFPVAQLDPWLFRALRARLSAPGILTARADAPATAEQARLLARFDALVQLEGEQVEWDHEALQLHAEAAEELSLEGDAFDLVWSNAVLEHVRDLDAVAAECARVLKPGGLTLHQVDFRDHRDFGRPWDFLTYSNDAWAGLLASKPFEFTNRRRHSDLLRAFASQGLELVQDEVNERQPLPSELRDRFDPAFHAYAQHDLEALGALVAFRKRG